MSWWQMAIIILFPLWWPFLGGIFVSLLDQDGRIFEWLEQAPTPGIRYWTLVLWPVLFAVCVYYKIKYRHA